MDNNYSEHFTEEDSRISCNHCEWWVPTGMGYLQAGHIKDRHPELFD